MAKTTIFSQIIKHIPRNKFESLVRENKGDRGVRSLNCWTWFGALLFSQLSGHDSIRAIERVFAHEDGEMEKLGFGPVRRSTLSDANHKRPVELLEKLFNYLLDQAKDLPRKSGFQLGGQVLALDSTFIRLCLNLCPWASYRRSPRGSNRGEYVQSAGIKMHTAIDLAGELPDFVVLKNGPESENSDIKIAKKYFKPTSGTTVIIDRGYWDLGWFNELTLSGVYFVTRIVRKVRFGVKKSHPVNRTQGILCDQEIYLKTSYARQKYKSGLLRRIKYREPDTGKLLVFITNRFDLEAKVICDLYKARWRIELFFKCLKQNLKIKKFLGFSAQAVKAQVWVALIAYLLIQIMKLTLRSSISMPDALAVIGTLLLLRQSLNVILGRLPNVKRHPPPLQTSFVF